MVSFSCQFSDPQTYDGSLPTTKTESWQFKEETCTYNSSIYAPTTSIASTTDIQVYASFTVGEILMLVFMFVLIFIEMLKMMFRALDRVKTKRKFLAYAQTDVEIKEEL